MLDPQLESKLIDLCHLLMDQHRAEIVIPAYASAPGYWFGGGNMAIGPDGGLHLVGRYRNHGDSRTGLAAGTRGLELAVFRSEDRGKSFEKVIRLAKQDLSSAETPVLSIEGSALRFCDQGVELFVSTEKDGIGYPAEFENYLKPGTGVWTIDRIRANTIDQLVSAPIEPLLRSQEPSTIHIKDPFLYEASADPLLFFCSHPFSWTCSNTGYVPLTDPRGDSPLDGRSVVFDFFPRGNTWDVAMSRGTSVIDVPQLGAFTGIDVQLMFYDGGECVRDHTQHAESVRRPRGHSCEELGGAAYFLNRQWTRSSRLSRYEPMFVSPSGTGCSRYVDVLSRPEGMYVTWQQSQDDGSQPLVFHFVPHSAIERALT